MRNVWSGFVGISVAIGAAMVTAPMGCGSTSTSSNDAGTVGGGAGASSGGGGGSGNGVAGPCASDKVCASAGQLCDPERHVCVECRSDADCADSALCAHGTCLPFTACINSRDCPADHVCDESAGRCVECLGNSDCASGSVCAGSFCRAACASDKDCTPTGQLCDQTGGYCTDCRKDADCGTGSHCDTGICLTDACDPLTAACLTTDLYTCDAHGAGYTVETCPSGCSDTGGAHCGGSGGSAGATSSGGSAGTTGSGGAAGCGDVSTSDSNCGACGYACVHGRHCQAGKCTPAWQALSTTNEPAGSNRHSAGFVGTLYVVFGGLPNSSQGAALSATYGYDVTTDTWSTLTPLNAARCAHEAVSTGTSILTFGGLSDCSNGSLIGPGLERYTPGVNGGTWTTINVSGQPLLRYNFASTWTGTGMFIYGGGSDRGPADNTGGLFDSANSTWSSANCSLSGCERGGGYSLFTEGNFVRVWGGGPFGNAPAGLTYDLVGRTWSAWTVPAGTDTRIAPRFADNGDRLMYLTATNWVSLYDRATGTWTDDNAAMPGGFCTDAAVAWSGSELIAWGGRCNSVNSNVGGRYQPPAPSP